MKTLDQLREFFNTDLRTEIQSVEDKRRAIVFQFIAVIVLAVVLLGAVLYGLSTTELTPGWYVLACLVIGAGAYVLAYQILQNRDFYMDFKTKVIERIVKFIDPRFTYISHKYIQPTQVVESKLFANLPKKYKGDDYVIGTLGKNTKIEFSEVHARHKKKHMDGSGKVTNEWQNTFKGLFFVAQVEKPFKGQTYVVAAGEGPDSLMLSGSGPKPSAVSLGNSEFESFFTVFSTDATEAKSMLDAEIQSRLTEFRKHHETTIRISFVGQRINVAVWHEKDLFEPEIFHTLMDFTIIEEYYDDLFSAISIVEHIDASSSGAKVGERTASN